jgi:hypothetical protein
MDALHFHQLLSSVKLNILVSNAFVNVSGSAILQFLGQFIQFQINAFLDALFSEKLDFLDRLTRLVKVVLHIVKILNQLKYQNQ